MIFGIISPLAITSLFPRTPTCAMIYARERASQLGQATTPQRFIIPALCPLLWVFLKPFQQVNTLPQRHNAKSHPLTCVYAYARAHVSYTPFFRCGVVPYSYLFEKKEKYIEIGHYKSHNALKIRPKSVVFCVVVSLFNSLKSLKNNKKGGFYVEI